VPRVLFESSVSPPLAVDVPDGGRLLDTCDEHGAPIPFSCRGASCGTCRIDVLEGIDELEPAADEELDILDIFGDSPRARRLACQARMRPGLGVLRIRTVNEE
jgi:2Fe-2S ferredoxin